MGRQESKVAIIADAAQGMGAELAKRFVGEGTRTVLPRYIRSPMMTAALAPEQIKVASATQVPVCRR